MYEFAFLETDGPAWHNKGQAVPANSDFEAWLQASNMGNWQINSAMALFYDAEAEDVVACPSRKILYRSDNKKFLADVGSNYNIVQPRETAGFINDLVKQLNFEMATMGVLFDGRRFWAQANIGQSVHILGKDRVDGKLLIATSCDGTMATTIQYTNTRVVCNNTLRMALGENRNYVKINHGGVFNAEDAKVQLGLTSDSMVEWGRLATEMAKYRLSQEDALLYLTKVLDPALFRAADNQVEEEEFDPFKNKSIRSTFDLFNGGAMGSDVAPDTLWQALNSVTEYADHGRLTRSDDARIDSAYFGTFANVKDRAWTTAVQYLLAA